MKIGQNQRPLTLRKAMALMVRFPWRSLVFILLYGLLAFLHESLPDFETRPSNELCKPGGTPGTAQDYECGPLQHPLTRKPLFLVRRPPKQLICLAPTSKRAQASLEVSDLARDSLFRPLTLDTITCWEAHER